MVQLVAGACTVASLAAAFYCYNKEAEKTNEKSNLDDFEFNVGDKTRNLDSSAEAYRILKYIFGNSITFRNQKRVNSLKNTFCRGVAGGGSNVFLFLFFVENSFGFCIII